MNYEQITENCSLATGVGLPISRKQSINICSAIRGMKLMKAKQLLADVVALKKPIAYKRYNKSVAHRKGPMAAGRFPSKACKHILEIVNSAEANAQYKGLSTGNLVIKFAEAHKGPGVTRYGRRQTQAKRTHIEIVLEEVKERKK